MGGVVVFSMLGYCCIFRLMGMSLSLLPPARLSMVANREKQRELCVFTLQKAYRERMKTAIHDAHQLRLAHGLHSAAANERDELQQMTTGFASGAPAPMPDA